MIRSMGIALSGLILAGTAAVGFAQDDMQAKYEKKVSEAWFTDNGFTDDYDVARERAKEKGRPIFAYFTRSYAPWPPCIQLENGPFSTEEFQAFAKNYVMFAHVTTRIEGRNHENLLSEKGFGGFPSLAALDENGDIIAKLTGGRDVDGFKAMMESGATFMEIRAKAEKTLDDEVFLLKHDIEMGNADLAAAKDRMSKLEGLSDEQKKTLDGLLVDLEIKDALGSPTSREEAEALGKAASKKFAEMLAAGREPVSDAAAQPFYILILDHAEREGDAALFERALGVLKEKYGDNPRAKPFFDKQDARLEALQGGGESDDDSESGDEGDDDDDGEDGEEGGE